MDYSDYFQQKPPSKQLRFYINLTFCLLVGGIAAAVATTLGNMSNTAIVLGSLAIAILPILLIVWVHDDKLTASLLIAAIAFSLPLNIDANLFYRHHVGGASGITINITVILLFVFFFVWAYRHSIGAQKHFIKIYPPLGWAALVLLTLPLLSLVNAKDIGLAGLEWIRLLCLVLAMLATMSLQSERLIKLWVFILSVQVFIQAGLAAAQYTLHRNLGLDIFGEKEIVRQNIGYIASRATGTLGHPNILSYFFEILAPIMLALALSKQPKIHRLWYAMAFAACIGGVLTTLSRGSWLTFPFSLTIVFVFIYGQRIVRVKAGSVIFILGCFLTVMLYFAYPVIEKRFTHTDYKSSASRMPLNYAALSIIEQYPATGIGLNNFADSFKRYDTTGYSRIFSGYQHVVHNLHLWIITEVGIIGFIAFIAPFFITMRIAWKIAPRAPPIPKAILIGISAGLLAHLAHGMVSPGFRISVTVSFLIFTLMGLSGAIAMRYAPKQPKISAANNT